MLAPGTVSVSAPRPIPRGCRPFGCGATCVDASKVHISPFTVYVWANTPPPPPRILFSALLATVTAGEAAILETACRVCHEFQETESPLKHVRKQNPSWTYNLRLQLPRGS